MSPTRNIIAIIPARGGSKAIPKKNVKMLGGIPLVAWPIKLARSIAQIQRVIVSSDSDHIIGIAQKWGAETPFKRPASLAKDDVPTLPVLQHAVRYLIDQEKYPVDQVLLLYPTTPFLKSERVIEGIKLLSSVNCQSVVGVRKVRGLVWKHDSSRKQFLPFYPQQRTNRQHMKYLYEEAGNIYFTKAEVLIKQNRLINPHQTKFIMVEPEEMLDIDTPADLLIAKKRLAV